jgi:hypothetical protein
VIKRWLVTRCAKYGVSVARPRFVRRRAVVLMALLGTFVGPLIGGAAVASSNARPHVYRLPSDGWRPGDAEMFALFQGQFHASRTSSGACASIVEPGGRLSYLWPAGYRVRFHPTELLDPSGKVVARQGDEINTAGGVGPPSTPFPASLRHCKQGSEGVAELQGVVRASEASAGHPLRG